MTFNNQLLVTFRDNTWVICRFVKSLGFTPSGLSFSNKQLFAQKFILEEVINPSDKKSSKEIYGYEIKSIVPIHNVPLLITLKHKGAFYERIMSDLYVHDDNHVSNRYAPNYEHEEGYYSDMINNENVLHTGSIYDNMIKRGVNDDCESYVYSIEPFLSMHRIVDYVMINQSCIPAISSRELYVDQRIEAVDLIHDTCHKTVKIYTKINSSYSTRNFDVDEVYSLEYKERFPTRKVCQDFLDSKLQTLRLNTNSEISKTSETNDVIDYSVVFPEGAWLSEALDMQADDFHQTVSSHSSWNW